MVKKKVSGQFRSIDEATLIYKLGKCLIDCLNCSYNLNAWLDSNFESIDQAFWLK